MVLQPHILVIPVQNKTYQLVLIAAGIVIAASALLAYIELIDNSSVAKWVVLTTYIASGPFYALGSSLTERLELTSLIFVSVVLIVLVYLFYRAFKVKTLVSLLISAGIWVFVGYAFAVLVWL